ncbi:PIN-like domain-containing protein [Microcoleus sp. FACHB-68]|uniref:PIN-like domain-containing protein n=1 Tax=Microcoleus sp. FACHB-68 TaxID=2692826 RepID=UPI001688B752|nr:PIN-like domain-containing protein [Microcoleus sp. FACHB-68]MBD1936735.1 DUF4935 domain-containing protein [Microcoleus sp. FACHB-68]
MKDLFPGYYSLSEEEFVELWKNCVFIIDTNSILNLYRYNEETRKDFINVLRKIENRLWIPHQVALEFQENRNTVINEQDNKFKTIEEILVEEESRIKGKLRKFPSIDYENFIVKLNKLFNEFLEENKSLETRQLKPEDQDFIRDVIDDLFKGKIGEAPTEQELNDIYKDGEKRYPMKYPPGFQDLNNKKKGTPYLYNGMSFKREYGDLILWKEILKEVKDNNRKYVIFITDDRKEDWWREEEGKTIGARPELVEEICKEGASIFYMYTPERFLEFAKKYIEVDVKKESIKQVEEISAIRSNLLYNRGNLRAEEGNEIKQAVARWLESEYQNDEFISSHEKVDLLRLTEDNSKIGYKVEYAANFLMGSQSRKILIYKILKYMTTLKLDEFYSIYIINNNLENELKNNVLELSEINYKMVSKNLKKQEINNVGFIIGELCFSYPENGLSMPIFKPIKFI